MDKVLSFLRSNRAYPLWVLLAGVLIILPRLGSPGFWEPSEIKVADQARERLEQYSLDDIKRAVTAVYRVRVPDLSAARNETQTEARNVAIYLAHRYTHESYSDLRRTFDVDKHEVVESVVKGMRERLGNPAETELLAKVKAVEEKLQKSHREHPQTHPPFTEWAVAHGLDGVNADKVDAMESGARRPLALVGLLALLLTYFLGARLGSRRAGLFAALALAATPLWVFQSRQLTSDIGAVAGNAALVLGLLGLAWPAGDRRTLPIWLVGLRYAGDSLLVVGGAVLSYYSAGALLGLFPPLGAAALASGISLVAERRSREPAGDHPDAIDDRDRTWRWIHLLVASTVFGVLALVVLGWVGDAVFEFVAPIPGGRALFGHSWVPATGYVDALGGAWRATGNLQQNFDNQFQQIAFGLLPWGALAPIAIVHLATGPRRGRRSWAGYALFGWAALSWATATFMDREVGPVHYPALVAIAAAVGMWLDDLLSSRALAETDGPDVARSRFGMGPRLPLVALFVAIAAIALSKDLDEFPERLTSIHVLGTSIPYPKDVSLIGIIVVMSFLFAGIALPALWLWSRDDGTGFLHKVSRLAGRWGVHAMIGFGLIFGLFFAQVWEPTLSRKLSSKYLFSVYHEHKVKGDRLGVMGNHGSGPKYYADDDFTQLRNRSELLHFLEEPGRAFALVPASELCPVHRSTSGTKIEYHVLDDSHASFLLLSNQLKPGEKDRNPLRTAILRHPPQHIGRKVEANFDNKIQLLGVDMPSSVDRGSRFQMTLYFKVLQPVPGSWKIFGHFDTAGMRFQGDHDPIHGRCSTAFWQPGDYIVDKFTVDAGDISYPKGTYQARFGFFQGAHGNWKNMKVVSGNADDNNRVFLGNIQVR